MSTVAAFILKCFRISGASAETFILLNKDVLSSLSQEDKRDVWKGMQG